MLDYIRMIEGNANMAFNNSPFKLVRVSPVDSAEKLNVSTVTPVKASLAGPVAVNEKLEVSSFADKEQHDIDTAKDGRQFSLDEIGRRKK